MPRPQRKEIKFSKDSILSLMQEIYNELVEQRNTAIRIQNKMISMMKDAEDMKEIGTVLEKQQKTTNQEESFSLSDMDDDLFEKLLEKDSDVSDEPKYRM